MDRSSLAGAWDGPPASASSSHCLDSGGSNSLESTVSVRWRLRIIAIRRSGGIRLPGRIVRFAMKALIRVFVLMCVATRCAAQDVAQLEQIIQPYVQSKTFMGTVLVARDAAVILNKGYGSANLEWNVPNTPTTKFRLGSMKKHVTPASILLLHT